MITIPILMNSVPFERLASMTHNPSYYYFKYGCHILVGLLLYMYLLKRTVMEFFMLSKQRKRRIILIELVVCLSIVIIIGVIDNVIN